MRENAKPAEVFISPTGAPMDVVHQAEGGLPPSGPEDFEVALESLNQWQIAWRRFKRHRLALIGSVIIFVMVLLAIFGPIIWPYNRLDLKPISKPGGNPPGWLQNPRTLADPFGTDNGGRSVFVLTVNGARLSMLIGLGTTAIAGDDRGDRRLVRRVLRRPRRRSLDAIRRPDADDPVPVRDPRRRAHSSGRAIRSC